MADDDPSSIPVARPIEALAYATPRGAEEVPEFVPVAEAALDRRASIRAVTRPFRSTRVAAEYVRRSLERRHSPDAAGEVCLRCGAPTKDAILCGWAYVVPGRAITVSNQRVLGHVGTCHAWCEACAERLRRVTRRVAIAHAIALRLIAAGGVTILLAIAVPLFVALSDRGMYSETTVNAAWWTAGIGIATFVSALLISSSADTYARLAVPRALRRAVPRWLKFERYVGVFEREAKS